jgi:hypothetical protein
MRLVYHRILVVDDTVIGPLVLHAKDWMVHGK